MRGPEYRRREALRLRLRALAVAAVLTGGVLLALPSTSLGFGYTCTSTTNGLATCSGPVSQTVDPCPPPGSFQDDFIDVFIPADAVAGSVTDDAPTTIDCGNGLTGTKLTSQDNATPLNATQTGTGQPEEVPPGTRIYRVTYYVQNPNGSGNPGGATPTVNFTVDLKLPNRLSASPDLVRFGSVTAGSKSSQKVTITNNSNDTSVTVSDVSLSGVQPGSFMTDGGKGVTLGPGQSTDITVGFTPDGDGAYEATLTVTGNDGSSVAIPVGGNGVASSGGTACPSSSANCCQSTAATCCQSGATSCCQSGATSCCQSGGTTCCQSGATDCCQPGITFCTGGASPSCPQAPPTVGGRYEQDLARAAAKGFIEANLKDLERKQGGKTSRPTERALEKELRAYNGVPTPSLRAGDGAHAATVGISKDDLDSCVDGLTQYTNDFTESRGIKGKPAEQIKELVGQLAILKDLLDPEKNKDLKPEDKKKILENALIALTKEFGGEKAGELTGEAATLFKVISGQLSKKEQDAAFKTAVKKLAKKLVGKDASDLADQIFTLVDVLQGNVDEEKSAVILQQSVIGVMTRLGGKGLLNAPQIRAFVTGYQLMAPFANYIVQNLVVIVNIGIYRRCLTELEAVAEKPLPPGVTYPGPGVSTGAWKGNPQATAGWSCATYNDPDTGKLSIQAVSPSGKWVILYDFTTGETIGQRGAP